MKLRGNTEQEVSEFSAPKVTKERKKDLDLFESQVGLRFRSKSLLNLAFVHSSYCNQSRVQFDNNERLEFLGDAVLQLIVTDYIFRDLPRMSEGDMTRLRSSVVSESGLSTIARDMSINNFVLIGKGEELAGGRDRDPILEDCFEAIVGAYYLDSGYKKTSAFVLKHLKPFIQNLLSSGNDFKDYKSLLFEYTRKRFKTVPDFNIKKVQGPDHNKTFSIEVKIGKKSYGLGVGATRKKAEQDASEKAYLKLTNFQDETHKRNLK